MRVREWMSPDPVTVGPSTEVAVARQLLRDHGIRHLPVVECGRVVGMVSDRDLRISQAALHQVAERMTAGARTALGETAGVGLAIETVMSAPARVINADEPLERAARLMLSANMSALPVLDAGVLVGVITTTDCLLAALAPANKSRSAKALRLA